MKFNQFELISSYYDGESFVKPFSEASPEHTISKTLLSNFELISKILKYSFTQEIFSESTEDSLWKNISATLDHEEKLLSKTLKGAFALPNELENFDLWAAIENKLEQNTEETKETTKEKPFVSKPTQPTLIPLQSVISQKTAEKPAEKLIETNQENRILKTNNIQELLKSSFQLPKQYEEKDLWSSIEASLDSAFHEQMFSENSKDTWTAKEKYFVGLSEFLDEEVSAKKAQEINDHLLECSICRKTYLSFSKLKPILKYSHQADLDSIDSDYFWSQIEYKLFPGESTYDSSFRQVQGF